MIAVSLSFPYEDTMVSRRGNGRFSTGILAFLYEETVVSLLETEITTLPYLSQLYSTI